MFLEGKYRLTILDLEKCEIMKEMKYSHAHMTSSD